VLDLYLYRGSFETALADEDDEQDSDRWYSHTPCGQEFAQIWPSGFGICVWSWDRHSLHRNRARPNLRPLVQSNRESCASLRTPRSVRLLACRCLSRMALPNGRAHPLRTAFPVRRLLGNPMARSAVLPITLSISRSGVPPRDGSLRVLYAARIGHCRSCQMPCAVPGEWQHAQTAPGECGRLPALHFSLGFLASS
jgi:hypothetical protein